jgi:hypothetical protein
MLTRISQLNAERNVGAFSSDTLKKASRCLREIPHSAFTCTLISGKPPSWFGDPVMTRLDVNRRAPPRLDRPHDLRRGVAALLTQPSARTLKAKI